jgi:hypothetical protein
MGGSGSGKTTLAAKLAARTALPVHHLDDIVRVGGGDGPLRAAEDRDGLVAEILGTDRWITEGVQLGWTEPLLERADVIVWLDYISWPRATRRIARRFLTGAAHEMRTRRGRERFTRFGDYARQLRTLGGAMLHTRHYYGGPSAAGTAADGAVDPADTLGSSSATSAQLARYGAKLVHIRRAADVGAFLQRFP